MECATADPANIIIIEDFMSKEHLEFVMDSLTSMSTWSKVAGEILSYKNICAEKPEVCHIMSQYIDKIQEILEYRFARKFEKAQVGVFRMLPGELLEPHADTETLDGLPRNNYSIDYSTLIHLNDDYSGGELYFPEYDIRFKPKAGNLVIFPSNRYFLHGVSSILSKPRFTSGHFWSSKKNAILVEAAKNSLENQHIFDKFYGYEEL
jgi:predicted 2-oxoglutarate/Fe(II)-dependent dioxygenase YbiX